MKSGIIFDIEEFALYDGPGVRQTVFLKGCPLRCSWCHNPEGQLLMPQIMVSHSSCTNCGMCKKVCRHESCISCGECVLVCPNGLRHISGEVLSSKELADKILKNSDYYASLGGGVTFSGGEPLMQAEFLTEVLDCISDVHCAVETSGFCSPSEFDMILNRIDYVLMDVKAVDSDIHKKYTGADNKIILDNLKRLCDCGKPFVIRIPVIPGVNDSIENYEKTAELICKAENLVKIELLPYHKTAGAKYAMINRKYEPGFDVEKQPELLLDVFERYGIKGEIL